MAPEREARFAPNEVTAVQLNPLLVLESFPKDPRILTKNGTACHLKTDLQDLRTIASRRNMFLSNPPCTTVHAEVAFETQRDSGRSAGVSLDIIDMNGITFGSLVDLAMKTPISELDGEEAAADQGVAQDYIRQLERISKRRAYLKATRRFDYGTAINFDGTVVPTEAEWRQVEQASRLQ